MVSLIPAASACMPHPVLLRHPGIRALWTRTTPESCFDDRRWKTLAVFSLDGTKPLGSKGHGTAFSVFVKLPRLRSIGSNSSETCTILYLQGLSFEIFRTSLLGSTHTGILVLIKLPGSSGTWIVVAKRVLIFKVGSSLITFYGTIVTEWWIYWTWTWTRDWNPRSILHILCCKML